MARVAVVTDSTCYLPPSLLESLGLRIVSLCYDLGGGLRQESDFNGDFASFYDELEASKTVAKTSPPSVADFRAVYEPLLENHESVVSVLISSGISDTCSVARQAVAELTEEGRGGERIRVIDSAGAAGHLGFQVLAAAKAAASGADLDGVFDRVRQARQEVKLWFVVDTLEYLRRGGRLGTAAAWMGSALDIKPILTVESEIVAVERVRSRKRALDRLVELMRQRRALGADRWFVQHANSSEDADRMVERLAEIFLRPPEFVSEVGPVIGTHTGPGALWVGGLPGAALA